MIDNAIECACFEVQQPIGRFLFRLTGKADVAEDLCQEVFLRVYHGRSRYRDNGAFANWLYRIMVNLHIDEVRYRKAIT